VDESYKLVDDLQ